MGNQKPKQTKRKGVGVDFKRVKRKVGRKLAAPENATNTSFKSKSIVLPEQSVTQDKEGTASTQRKQTLKELLVQSGHYSEKVRKESLMGMKELFKRHPTELTQHVGEIFDKLAPRCVDADKAVREAFCSLLKSTIFPGLSQAAMSPFLRVMMLHVCSAMTHLALEIRMSALSFLDLLVEHYPGLLHSAFTKEVLGHYVDLLSGGGPGGGRRPSGRSLNAQQQVLESLLRFLQAVYSRSSERAHNDLHHQGVFSQEHIWGAGLLAARGVAPAAQGAAKTSAPVGLHAYKNLLPPLGSQLVLLGDSGEGSGRLLLSSRDGSDLDATKKKGTAQPAASIADLPADHGPEHFEHLAAVLVPILLEASAECTPSLAAGGVPDASSLQTLLAILKILTLLFSHLLGGASTAATTPGGASAGLCRMELDPWGLGFSAGGEEQEGEAPPAERAHALYLPLLLRRLGLLFPLSAPAVAASQKAQKDMIAINMAMCQLLVLFLGPGAPGGVPPGGELPAEDGAEEGWAATLLDYFEGALDGVLLPSSGLSKRVQDSQLADGHMRALLSEVPRVVAGALPRRQVSLLEAFTAVYTRARPQSSTKRTCLAVMTQLLELSPTLGQPPRSAPGAMGTSSRSGRGGVVPVEVQRVWLQSLPKLLWDLKDHHPATSQVVLDMLRRVGQRAPPGSALAAAHAELQAALVPFFCISLPAKPCVCTVNQAATAALSPKVCEPCTPSQCSSWERSSQLARAAPSSPISDSFGGADAGGEAGVPATGAAAAGPSLTAGPCHSPAEAAEVSISGGVAPAGQGNDRVGEQEGPRGTGGGQAPAEQAVSAVDPSGPGRPECGEEGSDDMDVDARNIEAGSPPGGSLPAASGPAHKETTTEKGAPAVEHTEGQMADPGGPEHDGVPPVKKGAEVETKGEAEAEEQQQQQQQMSEAEVRRYEVLSMAACYSIGGTGDGCVLLELLAPAICLELASSPPAPVVRGIIRAVVECCCRRASPHSRRPALPRHLADALAPAVANTLLALGQEDAEADVGLPSGSRMTAILNRRLRPSLALLRLAPHLLPRVIPLLQAAVGPGGAKHPAAARWRSLIGAEAALLWLCQAEYLQALLLPLQDAVRFAIDACKVAAVSVEGHQEWTPVRRQRHEQLLSVVALLYGWSLDTRDKAVTT
eukprot:jgi/Mesen1/7852/ME000042S07294